MTIRTIRATVGCDGCGKDFLVEMDPAASNTARIGKWTLFDLVEDYIRGGVNFIRYVKDTRSGKEPGVRTALIDGLHLCPRCVQHVLEYRAKREKEGWKITFFDAEKVHEAIDEIGDDNE